MTGYTTDEPIYALATAYAPSALSIIRLSGVGSIALLSPAFSRKKALLGAPTNTLCHGNLIDSDGRIIDEVQLCIYKKGHGYTGEEAVEIMAHGSLPALSRIFSLLEGLGFRQSLRGEFTFRAFMHGRMDLTQAEAVEEIIKSKGVVAQQGAIDRLEGSLKGLLTGVKEQLLHILASLEVQLDYAEDEILEEWEFPVAEVDGIIGTLQRVAATYAVQRRYAGGAKVVLAGATNAGKSSLFNMLVKENRSIVSAIPGTTRDYIENDIVLDGMNVRLFDTAGLRQGEDTIEEEGIRRSESLIADADLVVYLVDGEKNDIILPDEKTMLVYSKSDLYRPKEGLCISTVTGEGIGTLIAAITSRIGTKGGGDTDIPVIESERQKAGILSCVEELEEAKKHRGESVDILSLFFQGALESLAVTVGEVTNDDILETLFSKFCVGK